MIATTEEMVVLFRETVINVAGLVLVCDVTCGEEMVYQNINN